MTAETRLRAALARDGLSRAQRLLIVLECALCRPDLALVRAATRAGLAGALAADVIRDACLQGVAYAGFPRALAALDSIADLLPRPEPAGDDDAPKDVHARGWRHFGAVYGRVRDSLFARLEELDPRLAALTIEVAYGRILSLPAIDGKDRELMGVGALCVLDQPRQLVAHAWGARNFGATDVEIVEAARTATVLFAELGAGRHAETIERELGT